MENQEEKIMVSVWCRTYNHVSYIRDALEGFVSQQTDFIYKVIVYDDASTDGTSDIVKEYAERYPQLIHAIIAKENTYHRPDSREVELKMWKKYLTGKYMALCEGDDFWIDREKLQKQVDYMETHSECSLYIHNALWMNCYDGKLQAGNPFQGHDEKDITAEELIMQYNGYPATASFLFRSEAQIREPKLFAISPVGDYAAILYALSLGKVHYSSRIMSVYRVFASGSYAVRMQQSSVLRLHFYLRLRMFLAAYDEYTDYRYHQWIAKRIACCELAVMYGGEQNILIAEYVEQSVKQGNIFPEGSTACITELEKRRKQELPVELKAFINRHKHIMIMGIGEFGVYAARMMISHQAAFDGFVVSAKKEGENSFMEKPVYNLSEIPYEKEDTGIVVGICPFSGKWSWDSVLHSLHTAGIVHYHCPFS